MDGKSLDITEELIRKLKEVVPAAFTEDKLDVNQLKQLLGENINTDSERYQLNWAGKNDAYKVLQQSTKSTLLPYPKQSCNWDNAENTLIEGENLEVLKLLQKPYYGKIKVICIDPPYNTGSDSFIYPDKFSETKEEYLKRLGDKDDEGHLMKEGYFRANRKENGQFHSNWLSMMLPRLFLARNLLKDDGLIFVNIDQNEISNLKLLMDEVFGEENYVQEIIWQRHAGGGNDSKYFAVDHEYILCYAKKLPSISKLRLPLTASDITQYRFKDKHFDKLGPYKTKSFYRMRPDDPRPGLQYTIKMPDDSELFGEWKWEENSFLSALKEDKVILRQDDRGKWIVEYKLYLNAEDGEEKKKVPRSMFLNEARNSQGKQTLTKILGVANIFNNPKPIELLKTLINIGIGDSDNEYILDFFAGSGSLGQAVLELNDEQKKNLKFLMVQLPEAVDEKSIAAKNGFKTISEITNTRINKVIDQITQNRNKQLQFEKAAAIGYRFFRLGASNFKIWRGDVIDNEEELIKQVQLFKSAEHSESNDFCMLWELLLKNGIKLNGTIETITINKINLFFANSGKLAFCFSKLNNEILEIISQRKPSQFICLDSVFNDEDCIKTNIQLKLEERGVNFKSV
ncbi:MULTISPECIES: site-specific DNA-methyltransferase [Flavobacterium]|uniref:site-specific DNA-methyltransferase n=1 Tax=Flavobacterium TaxID=237 RepID=UPI0021148D89|nr:MULTISPECIES: site-specific DNA-methyltransferase [Flavobacterium]UUF12592.1 site-specific DNA-methyltransferase [Flavobacterium panici]